MRVTKCSRYRISPESMLSSVPVHSRISLKTLEPFWRVEIESTYSCLQSLKLTSAPVFLHVPPRGAPKWKSMSTGAPGGKGGEAGSILVGPDVFDLAHQGFQAEVIAKWVSERTELHVRTITAPAFSLLRSVLSHRHRHTCMSCVLRGRCACSARRTTSGCSRSACSSRSCSRCST